MTIFPEARQAPAVLPLPQRLRCLFDNADAPIAGS
jgi:hypothetical protein